MSTLDGLDVLLSELDHDAPFPVRELGAPRGRQGSARDKVVVPEGWLDDTDGLGTDLPTPSWVSPAADSANTVARRAP